MNLNDFKIDKYNIDEEAVKQASLYQYYAGLMTDKQKELDKAELKLEQEEAVLKINLKEQNPKMTVDMLAANCASDSNLVDLKSNIIELKHEVATLKTAVVAIEHKRDMIQVEQRLQNNALYQQTNATPEVNTAERVERILAKQIMEH